jgi:hypothetical protein
VRSLEVGHQIVGAKQAQKDEGDVFDGEKHGGSTGYGRCQKV